MSCEVDDVCFWPPLTSLGGPTSFQRRLKAGLETRGIRVHYDPDDPRCRIILLVAGTRHVGRLWRAHRRGVRILQRLDGINWLHRRRYSGFRHFLRSEYGNWILAFIRRFLADGIVYQSRFVREWWNRCYGVSERFQTVIYNGVDLQQFTPEGPHERPDDHWRLLVMEGRFSRSNALALENALSFARGLARTLQRPLELVIAGEVSVDLRRVMEQRASDVWITWKGVVASEAIPRLARSAHLFFSAELNPACPNTVIEALACGLPVVGFDTGALVELVTPEAGCVVPYGANPWALEPPDVSRLVTGAQAILENREVFSRGAREQAVRAFGLDLMTERYLEAMQALVER